MSLVEQLKPAALSEIVGHAQAVEQLEKLCSRPGWTGDNFAFTGPTGIGKTSLATALCRRFADPFEILELDGDACTLDAVQNLACHWHYSPMLGDWKAVIVNEAHAMTDKAVQAWLTALERRPPKRIVCFTTTENEAWGKYTAPMLGRCKVFRLVASPGARSAFADRLVALAESSGKKLDRFIAEAWITKHTGSFRAALQELDLWL